MRKSLLYAASKRNNKTNINQIESLLLKIRYLGISSQVIRKSLILKLTSIQLKIITIVILIIIIIMIFSPFFWGGGKNQYLPNIYAHYNFSKNLFFSDCCTSS